MPAIAGRLRQYATAITDPTRGMIVMELDRAGELTATQLARRLGLTPNNVYHHMRVLLQLGVVDRPRVVPGDTYVEKYYRLNQEIQAAARLDPHWYNEAQATMTAEDRQALIVSVCLTMAHLLRQAAHDYEQMDPATIDQDVLEQGLLMLSVNKISREQLKFRMAAIRATLDAADREFAEDLTPRSDVMIIAGLAGVGNEADGETV